MRFWQSRKLKRILPLIITFVILGAIIGCTTVTQPRGWSGVAIAGGKLYIGSLDGKLVGLDATTRTKLFNDLILETPKSGGFLSCAPAPVGVAIYSTPLVAGDLVYVAGYNGKIYAVNASKGVERWRYPREGTIAPIIGGLAIAEGKLYFATSDGKVYALDAATGDPEWPAPFKTGGNIWATPVVDSGTVFIGSFDKKLHAVNASDGKEKWQFTTEGAVITTPLVDKGIVYFGSLDRYFYAVDARNGNLKWKSAEHADNWFWAKPVKVNNLIYAPNMDGKVYALNMQDGQIATVIDIGKPVSAEPVLVGSNIIMASQDGKVWSIDTGSNAKKLLADVEKPVYASLSASQDIIYIHTQNKMLHALNATTGVVLWSVSVGSTK